jgi:hypothetical protein
MQDLVGCDYFRTLVVFSGLDICNLVGDSFGNMVGISPFISKGNLNSSTILSVGVIDAYVRYV